MTYDSARDIEVSRGVYDALTAQFAATGNLSDYVFCNRDGKLRHQRLVPAAAASQSAPAPALPDESHRRDPMAVQRRESGMDFAATDTTTEMLFRVCSDSGRTLHARTALPLSASQIRSFRLRSLMKARMPNCIQLVPHSALVSASDLTVQGRYNRPLRHYATPTKLAFVHGNS